MAMSCALASLFAGSTDGTASSASLAGEPATSPTFAVPGTNPSAHAWTSTSPA